MTERENIRADLLRACSEAIEGLGRLSDALGRTGESRHDLITAMVDVAYSVLRRIETEIKGIMS